MKLLGVLALIVVAAQGLLTAKSPAYTPAVAANKNRQVLPPRAFAGPWVTPKASYASQAGTRSTVPQIKRVGGSSSSYNMGYSSNRFSSVVTSAAADHVPSSSEVEKSIRDELNKLFKVTPMMPITVRLAWHDAGTYDKETDTGGPNGSIRFEPESGHGANAGLKKAMEMLEPVKEKFPGVSYADFYQLASVQAIKFAGGPDIPFRFGRVDVDASKCTPDGRLPDADKRMDHLRSIFHRMGFTDQEIVALSGAHTLGMPHKDRSGFDEKPWTENYLQFDNSYYKEILKPEANAKLVRLVSDMALLDEAEMKKLCESYANDQELFFKDYAAAHLKLSELGVKFETATTA